MQWEEEAVTGQKEEMKSKVSEELKQHFRPEFLNRIDEVIVFHQLNLDNIKEIVDLMLSQVEERLRDRHMGIELTPAAKDLIANRGFDPVLGARPLRRALQRDIEDPMAEKILFGELKANEVVLVDVAPEGSDDPFVFQGVPQSDVPDTPPVALEGPTDEADGDTDQQD